MRKIYKGFMFTAVVSWLIGCLPMIMLYEVFGGKEYAQSIPGCLGYWDFLSVRFGDQFCLPLLNAGLLTSSDLEKIKTPSLRRNCILAACIGLIIGSIIQLSWVLPYRTEGLPGNWSFYNSSRGIVFNTAGWYHAFFFVAELGFLSYMFTRDWLSGVKCSRKRLEEVFRIIALIAGTAFLCFHNMDDYKQHGIGQILAITIILAAVLSAIYVGSQKLLRKKFFQNR